MSDDELLDTKRAAEVTGLSEQSIRRLCGDGTIKATKIGRDWIIRRGELAGVHRRASGPRPRTAPTPLEDKEHQG